VGLRSWGEEETPAVSPGLGVGKSHKDSFALVAGKEAPRHSCCLLESAILPSGCEVSV